MDYLVTMSKMKFPWGVAPIPKDLDGKRYGWWHGSSLALSSQSKHPEEAFRFMKFLWSEEGFRIFGRGMNGIPPYKKVADELYIEPREGFPDLSACLKGIENPVGGHVLRLSVYPQIEGIIMDEWDRVLLGQMTVDKYIERVKERIDEILKE